MISDRAHHRQWANVNLAKVRQWDSRRNRDSGSSMANVNLAKVRQGFGHAWANRAGRVE